MNSIKFIFISLFSILFISGCGSGNSINDEPGGSYPGKVIADYSVANNETLRAIPDEYIAIARDTLRVAYQHTSHGTHVAYGLFGLPDFTDGDDVRFAVTNNSADPVSGKLDFHDYALSSFAPAGIDASDLSRDETAFIQTTRNFLDAPANAGINVVMWSWCSISGHNNQHITANRKAFAMWWILARIAGWEG